MSERMNMRALLIIAALALGLLITGPATLGLPLAFVAGGGLVIAAARRPLCGESTEALAHCRQDVAQEAQSSPWTYLDESAMLAREEGDRLTALAEGWWTMLADDSCQDHGWGHGRWSYTGFLCGAVGDARVLVLGVFDAETGAHRAVAAAAPPNSRQFAAAAAPCGTLWIDGQIRAEAAGHLLDGLPGPALVASRGGRLLVACAAPLSPALASVLAARVAGALRPAA